MGAGARPGRCVSCSTPTTRRSRRNGRRRGTPGSWPPSGPRASAALLVGVTLSVAGAVGVGRAVRAVTYRGAGRLGRARRSSTAGATIRGRDCSPNAWLACMRAHERVVCVLNRKGRARLLACTACRELARCEQCEAAVTQDAEGPLVCGRCDAAPPVVWLVWLAATQGHAIGGHESGRRARGAGRSTGTGATAEVTWSPPPTSSSGPRPSFTGSPRPTRSCSSTSTRNSLRRGTVQPRRRSRCSPVRRDWSAAAGRGGPVVVQTRVVAPRPGCCPCMPIRPAWSTPSPLSVELFLLTTGGPGRGRAAMPPPRSLRHCQRQSGPPKERRSVAVAGDGRCGAGRGTGGDAAGREDDFESRSTRCAW